jgi:virginiamycin B lyase
MPVLTRVLLVLVLAAACRADRGDEHAVRRIALSDVPISARIRLPGSPDWLAVGFGSVWVVNYVPHRVSRVDPTTGTVLAEIPLPGKACLGIVVTSDRVLVPTCGGVVINEIDPATNRLVNSLSVPDTVRVEGSFAVDSESLWLPVSGRDSSSMAIARVDRRSGAILHLIRVPRGSEALVAGFGAVWVASSGTNAVLKIDPIGDSIVARIPVGPSPKFMSVGDSALWVQNRGDGSVSRINPWSSREVAHIQAHTPTPFGDITVGDSAVWLAVDSTLVTRIDPRTNTVVYRLVAGSGADAVRVGFGALWLADHEHGELWRVDLATLRAAASRRH